MEFVYRNLYTGICMTNRKNTPKVDLILFFNEMASQGLAMTALVVKGFVATKEAICFLVWYCLADYQWNLKFSL